ncbi:MAG TPA: ribonuclease P protein component [Desulfitobacteriaceae bacterium]|jgi:ribonuclease P protein component|nr:ribonuclease P protein component [Desulfitobacteriaceae bacterium]
MIPRNFRLKKKSEFKRIFETGKSFPGKYTVLVILKGSTKKKIGFIASKKVGNAVARNRARRLMREVIRLNLAQIVEGAQIVCIARATIKGASYPDVEKSILQSLKRSRMIENEKDNN